MVRQAPRRELRSAMPTLRSAMPRAARLRRSSASASPLLRSDSTKQLAAPSPELPARNIRDIMASAWSRLAAAFVDRHIAIIDTLLVHPFPAEPLLARQGG